MAVDDGVDSRFNFDHDPGAEMGARARMAVSSPARVARILAGGVKMELSLRV
jgi:hypothetical protein